MKPGKWVVDERKQPETPFDVVLSRGGITVGRGQAELQSAVNEAKGEVVDPKDIHLTEINLNERKEERV